MERVYERYVAIGDSTTEGLDDPDGTGGFRGWANRLAERLVALQGRLFYANLAVRGRRTSQIRQEQLERAVAMRPDLSTVVAGTNDLLRRRFDADAVGADVEAMQRALITQGATVLTFTLPDLSAVMPVARLFTTRTRAMNEALRMASARSGAILVDLALHDVASDPRLWSSDRLHANALGHARIADALAHAISLPGSDDSWRLPLAPQPRPAIRSIVAAELSWGRDYFLPWIWRHARGRSSGDGRSAKRPELALFER
jgi:lysophospholipase L1-like esterase